MKNDERVTATGADGVERLVGAPGHEPVDDASPYGVTMAPQQYDDVAAEFSAGPGDPHPDNVEVLNHAQGKSTYGHQLDARKSVQR